MKALPLIHSHRKITHKRFQATLCHPVIKQLILF